MKTVAFNVNHYVHVKLNDIGIKELARQRAELAAAFPSMSLDHTVPKTDADGFSKWQLHDLMTKFGHMMTLGFEAPFDTDIKFEIQELNK